MAGTAITHAITSFHYGARSLLNRQISQRVLERDRNCQSRCVLAISWKVGRKTDREPPGYFDPSQLY